jgi:predicted enzyme related to lactoylglutathione lyase
MKLGFARIFVRDIVEAKTFYSQQLGLRVEVADEQRGFCMFDTGATKLIVEAIGDADDEGEVQRYTRAAILGRLARHLQRPVR